MDTQDVNTNEVKNKKKETQSSGWQSGLSSAIGSTAGVTLGSIAKSAYAAESEQTEIILPEPTPIVQPEPFVTPEPIPAPDPAPTPTPDPEPIPEPGKEVTVVSYNTVMADDGSLIDIAVVEVEGQQIGLIDIDRDGDADIAFADLNNDGFITEDEICKIPDSEILMDPFKQNLALTDYTEDLPLVSNDYVNDGDVSEFMA